ncbi:MULTISPECIES: DNA repair protein RecN [Dysgonomonas]|uniref:DNA repair protein RecN n=1 Tax=Dysgonomonas TaxID=156973 RepID=UPI0009299013|nr:MULTISPECIES: DNA repair protein RecN [Dysgonomonas]MBN9301115.1 DNA repair protein RecN [Dysgonomonas mossii]OJX61917.1 MAG: DNA repair protein RecN [Dysgonomonas sp. 37-18]
MLRSLYIKNYALIDSLEIDFEPGFSVITGETGAGKSIILGALSLILGQRADIKAIKQGESKCVIEGSFDVSAYDLRAFCEEKGIEYDPDSYILRREILSTGKSRAFINDSPVSLTDLKELGGQLIDIHSQHQNLLLSDTRFQMQVVDALAGNKELLSRYQQAFHQYKQSEKALAELREVVRKSKEEEDYLRFQIESLTEAALQEGEQEELENELETLTHAEDIKSALFKIHSLLSDDDKGIVLGLKEGLNTSQQLAKVYARSEEISERLQTAYIDLKDLASEMDKLANDVEFNPERLAFIESRLDLIYTLQKKYHVNAVSELLALYEEFKQKIENIESSDQQVEALEKEVHEKSEKVFALAKQLTDSRTSITDSFEKDLTDRVAYLGMPNIRFRSEIITEKHPNIYGLDSVLFQFSANKNVPLQPVAEIASGGEISRLMLCLKSMIAGATALPTIIFDEIDTGVSGEIADKMGEVMREFGKNMQVLAITHLPQIAAKGKAHYKVYKSDDEHTTTTNLVRLSDEERLTEIARMLSGSTVTEAAIQNAKVMLGKKV